MKCAEIATMRSREHSGARTWALLLVGLGLSIAVSIAVAGLLGPFDGATFLRGAGADEPTITDADRVNVLGAIELPHADASVFIGDAVAIERDAVPVTVPLDEVAPATTAAPPTTAAPSTTVVAAASTPSIEASSVDIGWEGIDRVDYPWRENFPDWTVTIEAGRDGVRALTFPSSKLVEIYVRPTDTPASIARVFAHELGHVIDIAQNTDEDRQRWREVRGVPAGVRWWPTGSTYDFDTLAGDFAEAFAVWKVGATSQSRVGDGYTAEQFDVMAQLAN